MMLSHIYGRNSNMSRQMIFVIDLGNDGGELHTYEDCSKGPSRTKSIASSSSSQSYKQSRSQGDNVRIGNLVLGEVEIFFDGYRQQWWKGVPRPECDKKRPPGKKEDPAIDVERIEDGD